MQKKDKTKLVLWIVFGSIVGITVFVLSVIALISVVFQTLQNTEEYQLAYDYLIESEAFAEMGAAKEDVHLISFSSTGYLQESEEGYEQDVEITFLVKNEMAEVTCHKEDGKWFVCRFCTNFQ